MKSYNFVKDIYLIRKYLGLSQADFVAKLAYSRSNIARYESGSLTPSNRFIEDMYSYAFEKELALNAAKAQFFQEECEEGSVLLFHGARGEIVGEVDTKHSIAPNDFGNGFYAGESFKQAATWVCSAPVASVYCFKFNPAEYKCMSFSVNRRWMNAILYYRGLLNGLAIPKDINDLIEEIESCDYLIAPIADNSMYETLNAFVNNDITDEACIHALSMTNLGMQYVFKKEGPCKSLEFLDRLYLCKEEKESYKSIKEKETIEGLNKSKLAKIEYGRKGYYFDEIFKR